MNDSKTKGEAAAPAVSSSSAEGSMTLHQALQSGPSEDNIFIAAQRGDVATIREFIESGRAKATDKDDANMYVYVGRKCLVLTE